LTGFDQIHVGVSFPGLENDILSLTYFGDWLQIISSILRLNCVTTKFIKDLASNSQSLEQTAEYSHELVILLVAVCFYIQYMKLNKIATDGFLNFFQVFGRFPQFLASSAELVNSNFIKHDNPHRLGTISIVQSSLGISPTVIPLAGRSSYPFTKL
jgi:hypothetical protein